MDGHKSVEKQVAGLGDNRDITTDVPVRGNGNVCRPCSENGANMSTEIERKELNQLCRELLLLDGDIHKLETKLNRIKAKRDKLYLEIDKKLNGD